MEIIFDILLWVLGVVFMFFTGWLAILVCWANADVVGRDCPAADVALTLYMWEAIIITVCIAVYWRRPILQWLHYTFSPHPGVEVVKKASGGKSLDSEALASAMDTGGDVPLDPAFVSENRARQAQAAAERLRAETDLMDAAGERERARKRREDERRDET